MAKTKDGTIVDHENRVIFFSLDRFREDICLGDYCFICGASPDNTEFNNEHVIPRWILRRYDLFDRNMTLPNGTEILYGQNTVPCCQACNTLLGRELEEPMRALISSGFSAMFDQLPNSISLIFRWLCLIVFKTHYRDRLLRMNQDRRAPDACIGDIYDWADLHHIHAVARSIYTGCHIEPEVIGSIHIFEAQHNGLEEAFDFADLYPSQTVLVKLGNIAIVSVLNDSCGASNGFMKLSKRITGGVSGIQLREILAHLAVINVHIKQRPTYRTLYDPQSGQSSICATVPEKFEMDRLDPDYFGQVMEFTCSSIVRQTKNPDNEQILKSIRDGKYTFLFNADGSFNTNSVNMNLDIEEM